MNRPTQKVLTASLGLIMSAIVAAATDIPITSLPYTITAPGTYVFIQDLTYSDPNIPAITINPPFGAASVIVLDLRGHTLAGLATSSATTGILNLYRSGGTPITIKNGTIQNYSYLALIENGKYETLEPVGVILDHLTFNQSLTDSIPGQALTFGRMQNCTVRDCVFNSCALAIYDIDSLGGNRYLNNTFHLCRIQIEISLEPGATNVLKSCLFPPFVPAQVP